jgi:hypothetical protein
MTHLRPDPVPPLFAAEPDPPGGPSPKHDAAPAATGAGVKGPSTAPEDTAARLPLAPPVRRNAPDTSRAAARSIAGHASTQRVRVHAFIQSCGALGATDPEIAAGCRMALQSVNPRRGELASLGLIVLAGCKRPTPSGRGARVWVAREHAPAPEGGAE